MKSNALQRNSLQKNRQKSGIDCNVIAFVSGLRCTLSKTAVQRNQLQKLQIPTFGTVMPAFSNPHNSTKLIPNILQSQVQKTPKKFFFTKRFVQNLSFLVILTASPLSFTALSFTSPLLKKYFLPFSLSLSDKF